MTANRTYEDLLASILENGAEKGDRTGTGTLSEFGRQIYYRLAEGFPCITTKFVTMKAVKDELLWFPSGNTSIRWFQEQGITIWDEWADDAGELDSIYGYQWRSWPMPDGRHIDQIEQVFGELRAHPDSRRLVVGTWNPADLDKMALQPCHTTFQFYVADGGLSCQLYQRSADLFLGVPLNIASYALLTHVMAQQTGLDVGDLVWTGGDCHIYLNHIKQVKEQLTHEPYPFPTLRLRKAPSIFEYAMDDIDASQEYRHHLKLHAPVTV